jgi:hypothetical protein
VVSFATESVWCDVVGEGKPTQVPNAGANNHLLVMAASACIYCQIALGKLDPEVLAFTLNQEKVRFFWVRGWADLCENGTFKWTINYCQIWEMDLDLSILGDAIKMRTLTKVLRERNPESLHEVNNLWMRKMAQGSEIVWWWISNQDHPKSIESISEILQDGGEGSGVQEAEFESGGGETGRLNDTDVGRSYHSPRTMTGSGGGRQSEDSIWGIRGAGWGSKGSRASGPLSQRDNSHRGGISWLTLALSSPFRRLGIIN